MLLLIGFDEDEIERIRDLGEIYLVSKELLSWKVKDIVEKAPEIEYDKIEKTRIVIMHDVERKRISSIIKEVRNRIGKHVIFATTTQTSLEWNLADLIEELEEEDAYFRNKS